MNQTTSRKVRSVWENFRTVLELIPIGIMTWLFCLVLIKGIAGPILLKLRVLPYAVDPKIDFITMVIGSVVYSLSGLAYGSLRKLSANPTSVLLGWFLAMAFLIVFWDRKPLYSILSNMTQYLVITVVYVLVPTAATIYGNFRIRRADLRDG